MLFTRHWLGSTILFAVLGLSIGGMPAVGQDVFNGDGTTGAAQDPDNPSIPPTPPTVLNGNEGANWEGSVPPNGDVDGAFRFDLDDEDASLSWFEIQFDGNDWSEISNLFLDSNSQILFTSPTTNEVTIGFADGARIDTGSGAMWFDQYYTFNAGTGLDFDYGDGGNADALLINYTPIGTGASGMDFNLIINGSIGDGNTAINSTLTFQGGGWALLTGGTNIQDPDTEFALALNNASLMLAGDALTTYDFVNGVTIAYSGDQAGREEGRGIMQVIDEAAVSTGTSDTAISGYGALLVGGIDVDELNDDLGFDAQVSAGEPGVDGASYTTAGLTLQGDAAVVVGNAATLTATTTNLGDSTNMVVQSGGTANLGLFDMTGGTVINQAGGQLNFTDGADAAEFSGGLFQSYGTTAFSAGLITGASTFEVLGGVTSIEGDADFGSQGSVLVRNGTLDLRGALNTLDARLISLQNVGVLQSGSTGDDVTNIGATSTISVDGFGSAFNVVGDLDVLGTLAVSDGGSIQVDPLAAPASGGELDLDGATLGGGSSESYAGINSILDFSLFEDPAAGSFAVGSLVSGVYNTDEGVFEANYGTLDIALNDGVNLDLTETDMTFWIASENSSGNSQAYIDIISNSNAVFGSNSNIDVAIGGDQYIATDTQWILFNEDDIEGDSWENVSFDGFEGGSVTRSFELAYDGSGALIEGVVTVGANYEAPASGGGTVVQQRGAWLENESQNGNAINLLHELDQITSVSQYQGALARLGPEGTASALQVLSDTNAFNAYHEALGDMRTGNQLGRPGPARRPLSRSSQSLLASQDEADAVRSQYGYGAGAESGRRRQQEDDMVAFVQGYGRTINLDNMSNVIGVDGNQWGVLVGVGGQVSDNSVLGLLVGYDDFNGTLNDDYGSVDVGTVRVGPFFGWANEDWNVDLALTGGYNDWNGTRRNVNLKAEYPWSTGGWQLDFSAGAGYRIPLGGGLNLVPEASFVYSFIQTDSYTEGGNQAGRLNVDTNDLNAIIGRAGASLEVVSITGLLIEGRLGWQGNYSFGGDLETGVLGGGAPLPGTPDQVDRNNLYYGTQLTWMPSWDVGISFRYEGRTLDGTNDQYFGGGVSFEF